MTISAATGFAGGGGGASSFFVSFVDGQPSKNKASKARVK